MPQVMTQALHRFEPGISEMIFTMVTTLNIPYDPTEQTASEYPPGVLHWIGTVGRTPTAYKHVPLQSPVSTNLSMLLSLHHNSVLLGLTTALCWPQLSTL
jgi:hypothetical protein